MAYPSHGLGEFFYIRPMDRVFHDGQPRQSLRWNRETLRWWEPSSQHVLLEPIGIVTLLVQPVSFS